MEGVSSRELDQVIFDAALAIEEADLRAAFLAAACGGDAKRQATIEGWLAAARDAEAFFTGPTQLQAGVRALVADALTSAGAALELQDRDADGPDSHIGPYRLIKRLGEGGYGTVFLAEQVEPVRRKVALKVLRPGVGTEKVIARFEMELQALALMDHPNIAQVLDAGTTGQGRPYFVMELVLGVKITKHCDDHQLTLRQRLELFQQVCLAIQHAHQKGVIHRDIKPSNVLVSTPDGVPVPKVIDFGIARAIEGQLIELADLTQGESFLGTPAYMSPEQAAGGMDLDTRSDVYSLGVLLVELLTGSPPVDSERLSQLGMWEMLRVLREEEAPSPSRLLISLPADALARVASLRASDADRLIAAIRGDLDWIVRKALAKDRRFRYNGVSGLLADIRHYLADEPVSARPPGRFYVLGKLVKRHKTACAALITVLLTLVAGIGVSSAFYLRERDAKQLQVQLRKDAEAAQRNETRLLQQAKARESVSEAAFLLASGHVMEADELLAKTPLATIEPSLEAAKVFKTLAEWNAIRQRWPQAADCYHFYQEANRKTAAQDDPIIQLAIAPTLIEARRRPEYERFRADLLARSEKITAPVNMSNTLKACMLMPVNDALLASARPLADSLKPILTTPNHPQAMDAYQSAFAALALAMFELRAGQYDRAQTWAHKCLTYPDANQARAATAHAIAAIAAVRLGQENPARTDLAGARAVFAGPFEPDVFYPRGQTNGFWLDWSIARIFLKEAESQVSAKAGK